MKKKITLIFSLIFLLIIVFLVIFKSKPETDLNQFNVLLITLDTVRADHIGAYGNSRVKTPNIDKLANQGIRFDNCYTSVPITLPSHCTIFTGKYPITLNVRTNGFYSLDSEEFTLTEYLKGKDYSSFAVISAFVLTSKFGLSQGFDSYDDTLNNQNIIRDLNSEIPADKVYEKWKYWYQKNQNKKFFSWVHFFDAHLPYLPHQEFISKENPDMIDCYNSEISYIDVYIGKILSDLKQNNQLKNTLIVIAGDHGEAFGEHQEFGHRIFCYEECLKVPLIFYAPQKFSPGVIRDKTSLLDITPTIYQLFQDEVPGDIEGKSLLGYLNSKEDRNSGRNLFFESLTGKEEYNWAPISGVLAGDYKYILLPKQELYNLKDDPDEKKNLFRIKSKETQQMKAVLQKFISDHDRVAKNNQRKLSKTDVDHLKSLGYISTKKSLKKSRKVVDPKDGILIQNKIARVEALLKAQDYTQAEALLKEQIDSSESMKISYLFLAELYAVQKKTELAIDVLKKGILAFPEAKNFSMPLAKLLDDNLQSEEALKYAKAAQLQNPLNSAPHILEANIYLKLNQIADAFNSFSKAVDLEPENIPLSMKYADLLIKNNQNDQAVDIYDRVLKYSSVSKNVEFVFWYTKFMFNSKNYSRALQLIESLVKLKPTGNFYFYYAMILSQNQQYQKAVDNMNIALEKYRGDLTERQLNASSSFIEQWKEKIN